VVLNQVPRQQVQLRTDYRTLKAARPDLIHVSLTGFGLEGTGVDRPCYDLMAEGLSGIMDLTGEAENEPQKVGTPAADLLAGVDAALAAVAALFERQQSGRGHQVDVSLVESMTRLMTPRLVPYLGSGELPRRSGARDSVLAIYQAFKTADEPITLGVGNDATWQRFCRAIGEPGMAQDRRFATNALRRAARPQLVARIQAILNTRGRDHWLARFAEHGVPSGPIQRLDEVVADPGLRERGLFYRMAHEDGREVPQVNTGVWVDGETNAPRRPPPALAEHGDDVLRSVLDKSDDDIARLRAAGII
jgi:crotonobetainyl-CoA:carnitine CoA-transferase CaiB-like acyl-CoA transferase